MNWAESNKNFFEQEKKYLSEFFPDLIQSFSGNYFTLKGYFPFIAKYPYESGFQISDTYHLEIIFPSDYPEHFPVVKELDSKIKDDFHINKDKTLCLGTYSDIFLTFSKEMNVSFFFSELLIPFLYGHSYFLKFGKMPFPDRPHGAPGIIDFYTEYFNISDIGVILEFLFFSMQKKYKGHWLCPCGSNIKLRNCHGPKVLKLLSVPKLYTSYEFNSIFFYTVDNKNDFNLVNFSKFRFFSYLKKLSKSSN